jgi:hypothetical protein
MHTIQIEEATFEQKVLISPRIIKSNQIHEVQVVPGWQIEALEAYEESLQPIEVRMRCDLALRVQDMTGRRIAPEAIYADAANRVAVTTVDGIVFKLVKGNLVVLRPCVQCGCCQFASMPVTNRAELGYVLSEWEPRCSNCQAEDSIYWLYVE